MKREKSRSRYSLAAAILLALAASCHQPEPPEYYGFQDMHLTPATAGNKPVLSATVKLYNPNPYHLELKRAQVDVSVNGKPAGHSLLDSTIFIPGKDTFFVPVSLEVDMRSIMSSALQILSEKQANITLDGRVKVKKGALIFNRPFHYEGKQDLSSLLQGGLGL
jgi:LEA14-like dessication related protein